MICELLKLTAKVFRLYTVKYQKNLIITIQEEEKVICVTILFFRKLNLVNKVNWVDMA